MLSHTRYQIILPWYHTDIILQRYHAITHLSDYFAWWSSYMLSWYIILWWKEIHDTRWFSMTWHNSITWWYITHYHILWWMMIHVNRWFSLIYHPTMITHNTLSYIMMNDDDKRWFRIIYHLTMILHYYIFWWMMMITDDLAWYIILLWYHTSIYYNEWWFMITDDLAWYIILLW